MPIIKSAKKRVRVAAKQSAQNNKTKKSLRSAVKALQVSVVSGKKVDETQRKAQSTIDKAVKKGVISKNRAARLLSRLNAESKKVLGGNRKVTTKKSLTKKTSATKSPAKKKLPTKKKTTSKK
jgi:small subunit ribosomal protein S20